MDAERERDELIQRAQTAAQTLQTWFDNAPGFVALLRGPDFVFEMVNQAYHQLVGHRAIQGRPVFEALPDLANQGYEELLRSVYATGEPFVGRALRLTVQKEPGGPWSDAYVDLVYQPVRDAHGGVTGIFVQGHDVTEQVRAVHAIQEGDRRKDEFLATLAHELRNPLAPVRKRPPLAASARRRTRSGNAGRSTSSSARPATWRCCSTTCSTWRASRAASSSCGRAACRSREVVDAAVETAVLPIDAGARAPAGGRRGAAADRRVDADPLRLAQVVVQPADQRGEVHRPKAAASRSPRGARATRS